MAYFPAITPEMLVPFRTLVAQISADPLFLGKAECPYPPETKEFLLRLSGLALKEEGETKLLTTDELEREVTDLLKSSKDAGRNLDTIDAKDRMAILKGQSQLVEKLIELRERMLNLKNMNAFKRAVIEILDNTCTPAQRTTITKKLGELA